MQSRAIKAICYTLVLALVSAVIPSPFVKQAEAQIMPIYQVGVVDFINESGVQGDVLARLATDAVVVEMSKTNRYDVGISRTQMKKDMDELDIHPPLTNVDLVRLGDKLGVDSMLQGSIKSVQLAGSGATRRASVTLVLQMIDQASGEIINGAIQTGTSSGRIGYNPDDDSLITEAINNAAYMSVKTLVDYIIPEATVMMNVGGNEVMLNKGIREGMKPGMRMIILRQKEIIGYIEVRTVSPTDCRAKVIKSMRGIQPEDKARTIFEMPAVASSLKSQPLPNAAPRGGSSKKGAFGKIVKTLIAVGAIYGLASMFSSGRGGEKAPGVGVGESPTILTWDPSKYGNGKDVLEYQILRDEFSAGADPVIAVRDPSAIDSGRADVFSIYGNTTGTPVSYYKLDTNPATAYSETSWVVPAEPYGTTHTYQVRVLYRLATTGTPTENNDAVTSVKYYYTPVSKVITATAIEPVLNSDIVEPAYDRTAAPPEILVDDLRDGYTNFTWNTKDGADIYYMSVEPVIPGTGPTWTSPHLYATGTTVSLTPSARSSLAQALNNSAYSDQTMKWYVYCRNQGDTSPAWNKGEKNMFVIGGTPPPAP